MRKVFTGYGGVCAAAPGAATHSIITIHATGLVIATRLR